jgi:leucine dehydrogenase
MESLLSKWEGETVITHIDKPTGTWIFIAVHSTRLGPAIGGTRMKYYPERTAALQDALRLAEGMTYKWAAAGIDGGGGKAVIAVPENLDEGSRADLLRRYGEFVHQFGGLFLTGPDLGTSTADMDIIAETGAPYIFGRTVDAGGAGNPAPFTALGVFTAIQTAAGRVFDDDILKGRRILIQGAGSVGKELVALLRRDEAELLFTDVDEAVVHHFRDELGISFVPNDEIYETSCDIFSPCAVGAVLNDKTIPRLKCLAIAGAANNQLGTAEDAERLRERGILYAPDFIANSGGAIAIIGIETKGWSRDEAEQRVVQYVRESLSKVFEISSSEGCTTDKAAKRLAEMRFG